MKGLRSIVGAWLLLSSQATLAGVPEFFDTLFREYGEACLEVAGVDFADFCQRHELADSSRANREAHGRILFFHALLTGSSASDCSRGGILGIPYFWHTPGRRSGTAFKAAMGGGSS